MSEANYEIRFLMGEFARVTQAKKPHIFLPDSLRHQPFFALGFGGLRESPGGLARPIDGLGGRLGASEAPGAGAQKPKNPYFLWGPFKRPSRQPLFAARGPYVHDHIGDRDPEVAL